ncbi:MAG: extracellular solute-binding protein [Phycisphaerales bacterium]|nr:extracellular solute-binding protein [Phycisphaerales bacterium]
MRRAVWWVLGGAVCAGLLIAGSCERGGPSVVLYVSTDEAVARPILEAFERVHGIRVLMVGDTEASKTTGLIERLRSERGAPLADVFWSSEAIGTVALANEGLLVPHVSVSTRDWPPQWRDAKNRWHAFSPRPRVLVFDPQRVQEQDVPQTWEGLTDPRWRGEIVMADPRFGTTGGHLAAMRRWYDTRGSGGWQRWLAGMASNHVRMLPGGNAAVVDAVRRGEALLGATDADDVRAANRAGASLAMVLPRHGEALGEGPMLMPNTVAIVQGSPHPRAAALLVDWLCSPAVSRMLAASVSGNVPLFPGVAAEFPELAVDDPLELNLSEIEAVWASAVESAVFAMRKTSGGAK